MRILSGVQSSGKLHLGNYFGMMRPALQLQEKGDAYLFIANYHALTSVHDSEKLRQDTLDVALDFLAFSVRAMFLKYMSWHGCFPLSPRWDCSNAVTHIKIKQPKALPPTMRYSPIQF
jgi:hypothetical protein